MKVLKLDEELEKLLKTFCDSILKAYGMGAMEATNYLLMRLANAPEEVLPEVQPKED